MHCDIVVRIVKTGGLGKVALYENFTWSLSNAVHCMGQNIKITCGVCVRTGIGCRISRKR